MAKTLPVLILKDFLILPSQTLVVDISTASSIEVLKRSEEYFHNELLIVSLVNPLEENPELEDMPSIAVMSKIEKQFPLEEGKIKVTFHGEKRIKIAKYFNEENFLSCEYFVLQKEEIKESEIYANLKEIYRLMDKYVKYSGESNEILNYLKDASLEDAINLVMGFLPLERDIKQAFIDEKDITKQVSLVLDQLTNQLLYIQLNKSVNQKLEEGLTQSEKDYYLRKKINEILKELGEESQKAIEIQEYRERLENLKLSNSVRKKVEKEIKKYEALSDTSPDISFIRNYLDLFFSLPWNEETIECEDLKSIAKALDKSHFGLKNVKERILEYAAMKKRNPMLESPIICLVGPPGVGKSTIAYSIANALHRKFAKISVGGLNDSAELVGHRRTYLGSAPGRIVSSLQKCGFKNPVILIDEVDKMVKDYKGDPASVLLDILDPSLNHSFIDQYLEEPIDLSHVLFLLTANRLEDIPSELKDRLEIIEISSYSILDKVELATNYILPLLRLDFHVGDTELQMDFETLKYIILNYTEEAGVRDLRRKLEEIYRKSILNSSKNKENLKEHLEIKDVKKLLEEKVVAWDVEPKIEAYGLVKALAVTGLGGTVLPIETVIFEGTGEFHFTGHLGNVMKESMDVVISYLKANAKYFKIDVQTLNTSDIHIHALEASSLKDGPSAGVAITTSLISLLTKKKIPFYVAMSGEMSLRGEILPVSGIKEKIIGAYNKNIKTIFLPEANKVDVKQVSKEIINSMEIIYVKEYKEIYEKLFLEKVK